MAMRTASPWWASLVFAIGLIAVFIGERMYGTEGGIRIALTGIGIGVLVAITLARGWSFAASKGARRGVERALLLCQAGALLALLLYATTTTWGLAHLGLGSMTDKGAEHFNGAMTAVWVIVMVASLVPLVMIELSLGAALRDGFDLAGGGDDEGVEYFRVRDVGWSGLSLAFAAGLMMATCQVAAERNVQRDVSYFKTSSPGESTKNILLDSSEPVKVLLFFPAVNEVADQVTGYFEALAAMSQGKLTIEPHDRFVDADLAARYKVNKDGVIVLLRDTGAVPDAKDPKDPKKDDKANEKSQTIEVDVDIEKARRSKLRTFDREVNTALGKLMRDKRKAYLTVGHGEMNDPDSIPAEIKGTIPERKTSVLKRRLQDLNYEPKDLTTGDLATNVPDDATIVLVMAPSVSFTPVELESLDRYLLRGGRLFIAMDPLASPDLGILEGHLGIKFDPSHLTDETSFYPTPRRSDADHRFVKTSQFSAHASTTALSHASDKSLPLIDSGSLQEIPFTTQGEAPKRTITIHSNDTSFLDYNNNFKFDAAPASGYAEKKQKYDLAAAIEGPKLKGAGPDGKDKDGFRALVFADVDLFQDAPMRTAGGVQIVMLSGPLFDDSIRWLGGEEVFSGEVMSEDDKPIQHTKAEDSSWFLLTIIGVPLIVLAAGLSLTLRRKRRVKKTNEVTP